MNTYTVEDIKEYFNYLIKKYPNSNCEKYTNAMMYRMFGNSDDLDYFEKVMKKIKENT
jgi:hypothetical protein